MDVQVPTGYAKILEEFWHTQLTKAHEASEAYFYNEVERLASLYKEHDHREFVQKIWAEMAKYPEQMESCFENARNDPANKLRETGHIGGSQRSTSGAGGSSLTATGDCKNQRWGTHWVKYQSWDDGNRNLHASTYKRLYQEERHRSRDVWPGEATASQPAMQAGVEVDTTVSRQIKEWHP